MALRFGWRRGRAGCPPGSAHPPSAGSDSSMVATEIARPRGSAPASSPRGAAAAARACLGGKDQTPPSQPSSSTTSWWRRSGSRAASTSLMLVPECGRLVWWCSAAEGCCSCRALAARAGLLHAPLRRSAGGGGQPGRPHLLACPRRPLARTPLCGVWVRVDVTDGTGIDTACEPPGQACTPAPWLLLARQRQTCTCADPYV
jgi:hypothetical protein